MPARPLVLYPDPRLRRPVPPVAAFDAALRAVADDLAETLLSVSALGLTGPHIGAPVRLTIIRAGLDLAPRTYVNPTLVWTSPETARHREGSVSMPGVDEEVERPARVRVRFHDLEGEAHEAEEEGFSAACLQHEIDQLDGLFWIERLSRLKRERVLKRYAKLRRG
ncbi:peptide deformylase [Methylobacterium platani]|uniref:Peptide deformylase-like n=2 Tax=Methylobacterium platani TaxID=427683 RepID=A0A179S7Q4_9HYPH|nr:peptide deformylase [Methylobacterium platani]KMO14102.1 peptide deformylase [Methylobacterium platani JCM 14648]OAS22281.1 peptide deformylase [Methylobacterium platani]